jgi:F-type H+-transporting ATPase subunit delta
VNVATETAHETGLAGRYANAVFELAQESNAVDAVAADFASLKSMIAASPDFANLVKSPVLPAEIKAKAMKALLEKMGAAPITQNFILFLIHKRRLFVLSGIIQSYGRLVARLKGEVHAEVISARPLSDSETAELKNVLKNKLGREPRLQTSVDPTLLGGLIVKLGSRMIDSSIRTKLAGIRTAMRGI